MKRNLLIFFLLLFLFSMPISVYAEDESYWQEEEAYLSQETEEFIENQPYTIEKLQDTTLPELLQQCWILFCDQLKEPFSLFAKLCGVLLFSVFLQEFHHKENAKGISQALDTATTITAFLLISQPMLLLFYDIGVSIETGRNFMVGFIPVFSGAMISCGQPATAVLYGGFFLSGLTLIAQILTGMVLPFLKIFLALTVTKGVGGIQIGSFTEFVSKLLKWVMGFLAALFTTVLSFQTFLSGEADSLALRTGKLLIGNSIPIVGHAVSDAMGTVFGGLKAVKGTVGILGIVGIFLIFLPLLLRSICFYLSVFAAKTVASILGHKKGENLLDGFCECISLYMITMIFFVALSALGAVAALSVGSGGG